MTHQKRAAPRKQKRENKKKVSEFPRVAKIMWAHVAMKNTEPQRTILARLFAVSVETDAV